MFSHSSSIISKTIPRRSRRLTARVCLAVTLCFIIVSSFGLPLYYLPDLVRRPVPQEIKMALWSVEDDRERNLNLFPDDSMGEQYEHKPLLRSLKRLDWNNYDLKELEERRVGPGEHGRPVVLQIPQLEEGWQTQLLRENNFNVTVSENISMERAIPDTRTAACKAKLFLEALPENAVSVVIPFHDEHNVTILRTVHSVVNRSPKKLLREIVLVDDASTKQELQADLVNYVKQHFTNVRVLRSESRLGLINARITGADDSTGSILVFLDAHIEVNHNWLPALIEEIVLDYRTIVSPAIDVILADTFEIRKTRDGERGGFDWTMRFQRLPLRNSDLMDDTEPHPVPVFVGCAFAISRRWWEEIGKFDPGLKIWGGEQYEISFKSWQCGGRLVEARCSRVAHLFRPLPYLIDLMIDDNNNRNLLRIASVWMDEYKNYVFQRKDGMENLDPGDLTKQNELRNRLKCKPFHWYMTEVAPDIVENFPLIEPPLRAWGKLQCNADLSLSVILHEFDHQKFDVKLRKDDGDGTFFYNFDWTNKIFQLGVALDTCLTTSEGMRIQASPCRIREVAQEFAWHRQSGHIVSLSSRFCLEANITSGGISMEKCSVGRLSQSWTFQHWNATSADKAWDEANAALLFDFSE